MMQFNNILEKKVAIELQYYYCITVGSHSGLKSIKKCNLGKYQ